MSTSRVRPEWDLNHNGARKGLLEQVLARVNGTAAPSLPPVSYSPADLPRANAALNALLQVLRVRFRQLRLRAPGGRPRLRSNAKSPIQLHTAGCGLTRAGVQTSSHFDEAVAASLDAALPWLGLSPAESAELRLSVRVGAATRALSTAPADDFAGVTRALEALLGSGAGLGAGVERTKEGMQLTFARSNADTKRRELDQYVAAAAEAENKARQRLEEACAAALALCPPAPTPVPAPGQRPAPQPLPAAKIAAARKMAPVPTGQPLEMDRFPVTQPPAAALPVLASPLHTRSGRRGGVAPQPVPPPPPPAALQGDDEDLPAAPARHTPSPPRVALPAKRARAHAVQYAEGEEEEEEEEPNKRAAAAAATCEDDEDDAACEVCKQTSFGQGAAAMVLCDGHGCTLGLHLQCFRPPLAHAPEGSWFCRSCEKQRQSGISSAQLQGLPTATLKQMLAAFIGVPVVSSNAVWLRGRLHLGAQGLLKAVAAAGKGKPPQGRRTRLGLPGAAGQRAQGGGRLMGTANTNLVRSLVRRRRRRKRRSRLAERTPCSLPSLCPRLRTRSPSASQSRKRPFPTMTTREETTRMMMMMRAVFLSSHRSQRAKPKPKPKPRPRRRLRRRSRRARLTRRR